MNNFNIRIINASIDRNQLTIYNSFRSVVIINDRTQQ